MVSRADMVVTRADTAVIKADMVGSRATENSRHMGEANKANMAARREAMAEGRNAVVRGTTMATMVGSGEEMPLREAGWTLPEFVFVDIRANVTSYGGGGGYGGSGDFGGAMSHAEQHGGDSADSSIYSNVLGRLGQNQQNIGNQQIDEQRTLCFSFSSFIT